MKTLLFLARVTFIYNLCMVIVLVLGYFNYVPDKEIKSSIIVAGLFLSIIFNGITNAWILLLFFKKQSLTMFQPAWLFITNFLCFIFQIYMMLTWYIPFSKTNQPGYLFSLLPFLLLTRLSLNASAANYFLLKNCYTYPRLISPCSANQDLLSR